MVASEALESTAYLLRRAGKKRSEEETRTENSEDGRNDEHRDDRRVERDVRRLLDEDGAGVQVALRTRARKSLTIYY